MFHSSLDDYDITWVGCSYVNMTSWSTKGPKCPWKLKGVGGFLSQVIGTVFQRQGEEANIILRRSRPSWSPSFCPGLILQTGNFPAGKQTISRGGDRNPWREEQRCWRYGRCSILRCCCVMFKPKCIKPMWINGWQVSSCWVVVLWKRDVS